MNPRTPYTIGELAKEVGVSTSTIRYYERRGLVVPDKRSGGNYRQYGEAALERLSFIRSAQSAGFTLKDIELLLDFRDGETGPCEGVQDLIRARLSKIEDEIAHLHHVRGVLTRWKDVCRKVTNTGRCGVLDGLERTCECGKAAPDKAKSQRSKKGA